MTDQQEARSPIAPPWFITMDGDQPRVRWAAVLTRFLLLAGLQVLICVAMAYWSKGRIGAARVGLIVLPLAVMTIGIVWRAYRLALPEGPGLVRGQLSLLALLGIVTAVCVWLAMVRVDRQSDLRWRTDRARLQSDMAAIVGEGRVRWSGNQPELMVQVERPGFDDQDLQDVLRGAAARDLARRGHLFPRLVGDVRYGRGACAAERLSPAAVSVSRSMRDYRPRDRCRRGSIEPASTFRARHARHAGKSRPDPNPAARAVRGAATRADREVDTGSALSMSCRLARGVSGNHARGR